jgi:hypothetical protein
MKRSQLPLRIKFKAVCINQIKTANSAPVEDRFEGIYVGQLE